MSRAAIIYTFVRFYMYMYAIKIVHNKIINDLHLIGPPCHAVRDIEAVIVTRGPRRARGSALNNRQVLV